MLAQLPPSQGRPLLFSLGDGQCSPGVGGSFLPPLYHKASVITSLKIQQNRKQIHWPWQHLTQAACYHPALISKREEDVNPTGDHRALHTRPGPCTARCPALLSVHQMAELSNSVYGRNSLGDKRACRRPSSQEARGWEAEVRK